MFYVFTIRRYDDGAAYKIDCREDKSLSLKFEPHLTLQLRKFRHQSNNVSSWITYYVEMGRGNVIFREVDARSTVVLATHYSNSITGCLKRNYFVILIVSL